MNSRFFKRVTLITCFFLSIGVPLPAKAEEEGISRSYPIPNRGLLELKVPPSWRDSINQPSGEIPPTLLFTPTSGTPFKFLVTVLWSMRKDVDINDPAFLKANVEQIGRKALHTAVEKELTVLELKGEHSVGYYFVLTDKAPKPGEFRYVASGAIGAGKLQLAFTFLFNEKETEAQKTALQMLAEARQREQNPPPHDRP
jgi:hypothetical protein